MPHDPKEHFSEAQIEVITSIFSNEINRMLVKTIGAYVVTVALGVMALGAGWYRLGNVEDIVASIPFGVDARHDQDVADLQRQIDGTQSRLDRIEDKLDLIIDRI
jgi:hypothetical protein